MSWHQLSTAPPPAAVPPPWRSFVELVEAAAELHADAPAVIDPTSEWTYRDLLDAARAVAGHLQASGIGGGDRVGAEVPRAASSVVSLLGIALAGAAWVPLDPQQPAARRRDVTTLASCAAVLVARGSDADDSCDYGDLPLIKFDDALLGPSLQGPAPHDPQALAYVLFTSGSTGVPKGVEVTHANVTAMLDWATSTLTREDVARVASCLSFTFDPSILDVFATLALGGTLVVLTSALDPLLSTSGATATSATPSALRELLAADRLPPTLRVVSVGGEVLSPQVAQDLFLAHPAARILHSYGPTETTVLVTVQELRAGFTAVNLGRELPGVSIVLLDDELVEVGPGCVGEICVAGEQVARGYVGDAEATARRFAAWTSPDGRRLRLYRTGDRGRRLASGELEFAGRMDRQVKVRGFRVELGEVESALLEVAGVREAVVALQENASGGRLVAWVTASGQSDPASQLAQPLVDAVVAHVRDVLPSYMVPSTIHVIEVVPQTANGKVDVASLLAQLDVERATAATGSAAEGLDLSDDERAVAAVVADVAGLATLPAADDLVISDLGATSLQLLEVVTRLERSAGRRLDLGAALSDASIADLAAMVATSGRAPARTAVTRGRWWRRGR